MRQPTALEQEFLYLVNRMRMNPQGELEILLNSNDADIQSALEFFNVNLSVLQTQWNELNAINPVAWSENLETSAATHSGLMIAYDTQSHNLPNEASLPDRISATGYDANTAAENIFAFGKSVFYSHAAFAIDWSNTLTGIQNPAGHRNIIMGDFREIGIDVTVENDLNTEVGDLVVTQHFADTTSIDNKGWLLGTAFTDLNDDSFYNAGEGLDGVLIAIEGINGTSFNQTINTWEAGGYQILLDNGNYQVEFSHDGNVVKTEEVVIDNNNVLIDLVVDGNSTPTPQSQFVSSEHVAAQSNFVNAQSNGLLSFSDQTIAAGVNVAHQTTLARTDDGSRMMGGAAVGDFNNDGWTDFFYIGGGANPDSLFINQKDGTFVDIAAQAGLADLHIGSGAAVGDYDGDGWLDIYVTSFGSPDNPGPGYHRLYRNNGDLTFTDVAQQAGVNQTSPNIADGFGATFGDYDLDGDLDLFVAGWRIHPELGMGNRLFRNEGDGTFSDVTIAAGVNEINTDGVRGFTPTFADTDGDRYPELLLVADFGTSRYYKNNTDGTFTEYKDDSSTGLEWSGMGSTVGDFNNDGRIDWYATAIFDPVGDGRGDGNKLYLNQGDHIFQEVAKSAGVDDGAWGWGATGVDLNHDGWLDIVETNGWDLPAYDQKPARVWLNNGINDNQLTFTELAQETGLTHNLNGLATLRFDYDNDGDQDVIITSINDELRLYRNDLSDNYNSGNVNWLRVFLDTSNSDQLAPNGIGSTIKLYTGDQVYTQQLVAQSHYLSQSELSAHFGLQNTQQVDKIEVLWNDGTVSTLNDVNVNQTLTINSDQSGQNPSDNSNPDNNNPPIFSTNPNNVQSASASVTALSAWRLGMTSDGNDNFMLSLDQSGVDEFVLDQAGNLSITGTLNQGSSYKIKENFSQVNPEMVLNQIENLPIANWNYINDDDSVRHISPMAEDFYNSFGLGIDNQHLAPSDVMGVALSGIQGLISTLNQQTTQISDLSGFFDNFDLLSDNTSNNFNFSTNQTSHGIPLDFVFEDDVIINGGSLAVGRDAVDGENFGFDTIRLKEDNLRIHFDDTSNSNNFPRNDWRILINDTTNGGDNYFAIQDSTANRVPFLIEAGAPTNALYVESDSDVGIGTSEPVVELHLVDGNTPAIRLEQDGSSGFGSQTWDLAGNEANFFIRDVTNNSKLPFKIKPNAPTGSFVINNNGDVGIGVGGGNPASNTALHIEGSNGSTNVQVEETNGTVSERTLLNLTNNGAPLISLTNSQTAENWLSGMANNDNFIISQSGMSPFLFELDNNGNLNIQGTLNSGSSEHLKENFTEIDSTLVLNQIESLPVSLWNYIGDPDTVMHLGPTAEDFYSAFGLGIDNEHISLSDLGGITLLGIQELITQFEQQQQQIDAIFANLSNSDLEISVYENGQVQNSSDFLHGIPLDEVFFDDVIVEGPPTGGGLAVGLGAIDGESFGADTIRLKEDNLRIHFNDTSNSGSFPSNDWRILINDTSNGGRNYFAIEDSSANRVPFLVEAGASNNALYVESDGDVGIGTSDPVMELHIVDGDTPTIRLQQDGSSNFGSQIWDIAGNETNFFFRDVTNNSKIPFKIRPNAPTSSLDIQANGEIGLGTQNPDTTLHVRRSNGNATMRIEETSGTAVARDLLNLVNYGAPQINLENSNSNVNWTTGMNSANNFIISDNSSGTPQFELDKAGNLTIAGTLNPPSSVTVKENFLTVDPTLVLNQLESLPISLWNYKSDPDTLLHVGPTAQDFYNAFGLGIDNLHISPSDLGGIALSALQGLIQWQESQNQQINYLYSLVNNSQISSTTSFNDNSHYIAQDEVFSDDVIINGGSLAVGSDAVDGENFGFDTIRLKENNLRIHFDDTSSSGSFPNNDWRIIANSQNNDEASYFAIEDATANRIPFLIEAGAPDNALYVESDGDVGLGTKDPVVEIHIVDGDSTTVRLTQDGSSGFGAQTWDIVSNEANFFVRDVNNSSKLPFRIRPNAPTDSFFIANNGNIGIGTDNPDSDLHLIRGNGTAAIKIEEASGTTEQRNLLELINNGAPSILFTNTFPVVTIQATDATAAESPLDTGIFTVSRIGSTNGNLTVSYTISGSAVNGNDYDTITNTVTIPNGRNTVDITINPIDDSDIEIAETVVLTLTDGANYDLGATITDTVTINSEDVPTLTIAATDNTAAESPLDTGTFTVTRTGDPVNDLTVNYSISGDATNGSDYNNLSGTVTIPTGQNSVDITITPIDDTESEADEKVTLTLVDTADYDLGANTSDTVTITSEDLPEINITATDSTAAESPLDTGNFTVTRTGDLTNPLTINYSVSGDATNGSDYNNLTGTVTIAANQSSADITITPIDDTEIENSEKVTLTISPNANYNLGTNTSDTVTINSEDVPTVTITATDNTAKESPLDTGTFTVTRSGNPVNNLTVNYNISGTATNGSDYNNLTGTVTIPVNQNSANITITPIDDTEPETDEKVTLTLVDTADYDLGTPNSALLTLISEDAPANDNFANASNLGNVTTTTVNGSNFRATGQTGEPNHANASLPLNSVWYSWSAPNNGITSLNTNGSNFDTTLAVYTGNSVNALTQIASNNNESGENNWSNLSFSANAGTTYYFAVDGFSGIQGDVALNLDFVAAALPTLSINDVTVNEGKSTATFTVSLSTTTNQTVTVDYATSNGTANAGSDYTNSSGTVTIPANSSTATINVPIINDSILESNETFNVNLSNPNNATINDGTGVGTITDNDNTNDDFANATSLGNTALANATGTNVNFTSQSGEPNHASVSTPIQSAWYSWIAPSSSTTIVDTFGSDFNTTLAIYTGNSVNNLTTIASNNDSQNALINVLQSKVSFTPVAGTTYYIAVDGFSTETGNINLNLSQLEGTISINDLTIFEDDGTANFTVTVNGTTSSDVTVDYATSNGTATAGTDYTNTTGTLTIPAGTNSTAQISVPITNNGDAPTGGETFTVNLTNPSANASISDNSGLGTILLRPSFNTITPSAAPYDYLTGTTGVADVFDFDTFTGSPDNIGNFEVGTDVIDLVDILANETSFTGGDALAQGYVQVQSFYDYGFLSTASVYIDPDSTGPQVAQQFVGIFTNGGGFTLSDIADANNFLFN